jgi:hypothetical protein
LKTSYKEDKEVILMLVSWVKAGTFISDLYSPLVLNGNQTIKGKSKFTPQTLWKCTAQDLEKKFGVAAKNVGGRKAEEGGRREEEEGRGGRGRGSEKEGRGKRRVRHSVYSRRKKRGWRKEKDR